MQNLTIPTYEDIRQIVKEETQKNNAELIQQFIASNKTASKVRKYYTRKEVCHRLKITLPTLSKYVKNDLIDCHKIGRRVLFTEDAIEKSIIKRKFK